MADSTPKRSLLGRLFAPFYFVTMFPFSSRLHRYGRIDAWVVGLTFALVFLSIVGFTSFHKSLHPSFDTRTVKTISAGSIYDDFLTDEGKAIGSVRAGQEVELVAYGEGYFLVQTASGERGWVNGSVIDRNYVVATSHHDDAEGGTPYTFVRYEGDTQYNMVAVNAAGISHTFYRSQLFPTAAYGLPCLGLDDSFSRRYIYVTERWMARHFVEGREYADMTDRFYGFPVVIDIVDANTKKVVFPLRVKDFDTNRFHPKVTALFVNDKLVSYELREDGKIPLVERFIPFGGRIASTRLFIKLRSRPFIESPHYDDQEDVVREHTDRGVMPLWARIPIIILLVLIGYLAIMAHLMISPVVAHLIDRLPFTPDALTKPLFALSGVVGAILLYMIYVPHWIVMGIYLFFGYLILRGFSDWELYCYCPTCRKFYTLRTLGYGQAKKSHYTEVIHHKTEEVTKRGGQVVGRRTVGGWDETVDRTMVEQNEYIVCDHCGQKFLFYHLDNKLEGCKLVDEWPAPVNGKAV